VQEQGWLDDLQRQVDEMQAKSQALQATLSTAEGRATSSDGLVTVAVTPGGGLKDLRVDDRALRHGGARLTALIMETYGKAQRKVSQDVLEAFTPIAGGTEVMDLVKTYLPLPVDDEEPEPPAEPPRAEPPRAAASPSTPPTSTPPPNSPPPGAPAGRPPFPPPAAAPSTPPAAPPPAGPPTPPAQPDQPRPTSGPHRRRAAGEEDDEMDPW